MLGSPAVRGWIACVVLAALLAPAGAGWAQDDAGEPAVLPGRMLRQPWTGDFEDMVHRRKAIRVLTTLSRTSFFIEGGRQRGIAQETFAQFEKVLRKKLGQGRGGVDVMMIPVSRDELLSDLLAGRGDIAAAGLTITPDRKRQVAFTDPVLEGISELVVTHAGEAPIASVEGLAGRDLWVRQSSSYHETLLALNRRFEAQGREPIAIHPVDEHLETEDILEMVSAGQIPATVCDSNLCDFWSDVLPDLRVHRRAALRQDVSIAYAVRPDSPRLLAELNAFVRDHKKGTLFGNVIYKRYLERNHWVRNPGRGNDHARFVALEPYFDEYAGRYGFDPLLIAAQGYQESGLDQSRRSSAGAIGVMQLLRSTARSKEVGVPNIDRAESNIHAGSKYMRVLMDRYFADPDLDPPNRYLMALAAYNAGPTRIRRLRREAPDMGIDPNVWFGEMETLVAMRVSSEPVRYVRNIFKYYYAYQYLEERDRLRSSMQ